MCLSFKYWIIEKHMKKNGLCFTCVNRENLVSACNWSYQCNKCNTRNILLRQKTQKKLLFLEMQVTRKIVTRAFFSYFCFFFILVFCCLLVCFLKLKIYIVIHIRLSEGGWGWGGGWARDFLPGQGPETRLLFFRPNVCKFDD